MIIFKPEIKLGSGEVVVSAKVELQNKKINVPETLWFKFPEDHKEFVTEHADGFIAALFMLGMRIGEDIEVKGTVSPILVQELQKYQKIVYSRSPKLFRAINIKYHEIKPIENCMNAGGCTFSGGVDSFYTLWKHLPQNEHDPEKQISHALFIHGFDISIDDEKNYKLCKDAYEKLMAKLGIKLLILKTNVRKFLEEIKWHTAFCPVLMSSGFMLGKLLSRFYVASSFTDEQLEKVNTLFIEYFMNTDTLKIINDGFDKSRYEKTEIISNWPLTYPYLHVCWENLNGLDNCCRCEKCLRTMIALKIEGSLQDYKTFPLPLTRNSIRFGRFWSKVSHMFLNELKYNAIKNGKKDIVFDIDLALLLNKIPVFVVENIRNTKHGQTILGHLYNLIHKK